MKVIQLINGMTTGGAETLVKDYVTHSPEGLTQVVVLTNLFTGSPHEQAIRAAGVELISIPENLGWGGKRQSLPVRALRCLLEKPLFVRELKKILRREKPDCVHAHLAVLPVLAGCIRELKGVRVVYTCHSEASVMLSPDRKELLAALRALIQNCDLKIIALHHRMAREINDRFGPGTSFPVNNCVDLDRFRNPGVDPAALRRELGIPEAAFVIGHVGRFSEEKNQSFLAEVFRQLCSRREDAFLLMVGSGETRQAVRQQLAGYHLTHRCLILENRSDVHKLMAAMDVFVFPSLFEGFPVVLLEAQAAGRKCVISDTLPESVALTDLVVPMPLSEGPEGWCDAILSDRGWEPGSLEKLSRYDIHGVLRHLQEIYGGKNG